MNRNKLGKGIDDCDEEVLNKATEEYIKAIYKEKPNYQAPSADDGINPKIKLGDSVLYDGRIVGVVYETDSKEFKVKWEDGTCSTEQYKELNGFNSISLLTCTELCKKKENYLVEQHISDNTDSSTLRINDVNASEFFEKKHQHYFKDVSKLEYVDIYRVLKLWEVSDPCLQHAAKKILVAGNRGHKDIQKDIQEAIDSLLRWQEMFEEDNNGV